MRYTTDDGAEIQIDELDRELVEAHRWKLCRARPSALPYAYTIIARKKVRLHRLLMGAEPGEMIDHANGDTLDNRRANLRRADHHESRANEGNLGGRSQHRGVSWSEERQLWRARLRCQGRSISLGYFVTEDEAAAAWNAEAVRQWGTFARLNKVPA